MKNVFFLALALTVLAGVSSCRKNDPERPPEPPAEKYRQVTITAGAVRIKTSLRGDTLTWSTGDKLNIVPRTGSVEAVALEITSGYGTDQGTFSGKVDTLVTDNTEIYGWCGGDWTYSSGSFSVHMPATQTYVDNGLAENAYPSIGTGTIRSGIMLSNPMGVLKITVKGADTIEVKSVSVTSVANNLAGLFAVDQAGYAVSGGSSKTLTLDVVSPYVALSSAGVNFHIVVPPAEYAPDDLTVTITKSDDTVLSSTFADTVTVTAGNATAREIQILPEGPLPGVFSVSATKRVRFSKGNLQATCDGASYSWGFAEHQYDYIGYKAGNTTIDSQTNGSVVDLFGWSTKATCYGISTVFDYRAYAGDFKDWGTAIDDDGTWFTLSNDEWSFLFGDTSPRKDSLYRYGVTVCGNPNCLVSAPDDFEGTIESEYDASTWSSAEVEGLVCLPASGFRSGNYVYNAKRLGTYWSSTPYNASGAYLFGFDSGAPYTMSIDRDCGRAVRLVSAAR